MPSDIIHTVTSSEESIVLFEMNSQNGQLRPSNLHPHELAAKSTQALGQAMGTIQVIANRTTDTIAKLPQKPSEFELEFGIKIDAELGAIVSKNGSDGNLRVKLVWQAATAPTEEPSQ